MWVRRHPELFWIAFGVLLVTMISMACCTNVRRKSPLNFIFLGLFTFAQSFIMATAASRFNSEEVSVGGGLYFTLHNKKLISKMYLGFNGSWDNGGRLSGPDIVCIPNKVGLYGDGRCVICGRHHFNGLWHCGDFCSRQNDTIDLRIIGCPDFQYLFGVRYTNDDGW